MLRLSLLQTYGIKNKKTGTIDVMTYVDYVEMNGPAWIAGMRKGKLHIALSVQGGSCWSSGKSRI